MKDNYKTIDGAAHPHHLFQMTLSKTHSINLLGLHDAMSDLNVLAAPAFAILYFVVPKDVFPVFANPAPVAVGAHAALPANVHLMVLEMPLRRAEVKAKRKVRRHSALAGWAGLVAARRSSNCTERTLILVALLCCLLCRLVRTMRTRCSLRPRRREARSSATATATAPRSTASARRQESSAVPSVIRSLDLPRRQHAATHNFRYRC